MESSPTPNPYESPAAADATGSAEEPLPARRLAIGEPIRAAGSLSIDDWHEAEWLISQRFRGATPAAPGKRNFAAYTATAAAAWLAFVALVAWRGLMHPVVLGVVGGLGLLIAGTLLLYVLSTLRLRHQWRRRVGPFRPAEFVFTDNAMNIDSGRQRTEVAWNQFDFYRRNRRILLLHLRGAQSSLIVARSLFASPTDWERLCQAVDVAFHEPPPA